MRKIETRKCLNCGKLFFVETGGIVPSVTDYARSYLCPSCRFKNDVKVIRNIFDKLKKE